ncbi:hypothetical protein [Rhizobium sp. L1K21]|uniref:hypothetical protein n=1 Tax=Rhizobium sp. L1K21 TaxID=2954933 RepID=UPI002092CB21|nr:hypothetical protein [Rhizobium sp. L1K21]MCO6188515.1 hypothetical protein [Rhizobium sp. L1K21]
MSVIFLANGLLSGPFVRDQFPLALMKSASRIPIKLPCYNALAIPLKPIILVCAFSVIYAVVVSNFIGGFLMRTLLEFGRWATICFAILVCSATPSSSANLELRQDLVSQITGLRSIYLPSSQYDGEYDPDIDLPQNRKGLERPHAKFASSGGFRVIRLSGVIERGDTEKLQAFIDKTYEETGIYDFRIALDSPGGNFLEGIKIGLFLEGQFGGQDDPAFSGTYVLKGHQCLSACALIFSLSLLNNIEAGGEVGFHMGILPKELEDQQGNVKEVMNLTYDIVNAYMSLITQGVSPPELLVEALKHRESDSFFVVEANDLAYKLRFEPVAYGGLSDALNADSLPDSKVVDMCTRLLWLGRNGPSPSFLGDGDFVPPLGSSVKELFKGREDKALGGRFLTGEKCIMALSPNGNLLIEMTDNNAAPCVTASGSISEDDWCEVEYPPVNYATTGLLADVTGCSMGNFTGTVLQPKEGNLTHTGSWTNAKTYSRVSMRLQPSVAAEKIATLPDQLDINLLECAITDDDQAVWVKAEADGQTGWISARFVSFEPDWQYEDPRE